MESPVCNVWIRRGRADGRAGGLCHGRSCGLPHGQAKTADGELYQLDVARKAQGFGLGATLFDKAMNWLEQEGRPRIWLGVWSGNFKAQLFYSSRGFRKVGDYHSPSATGATTSSSSGAIRAPFPAGKGASAHAPNTRAKIVSTCLQ